MKQLITIALGVALGIAGYVCVTRYLHAHSATVVVQRRAAYSDATAAVEKSHYATQEAESAAENVLDEINDSIKHTHKNR